MNDENRAFVPRQTTYRRPESLGRNQTCASCGEQIERGVEAVYERDSAWGDVPLPVHPECVRSERTGGS